MKYNSKKKIMQEAQRALKQSNAYRNKEKEGCAENYVVQMVLCQGNWQAPKDLLAYAVCGEDLLSFHPGGEDLREWPVPEYVADVDCTLFENLSNQYELVAMTLEAHLNAWLFVEAAQGDIYHPIGLCKYLDYCKRNGITDRKLFREVGYKGVNIFKACAFFYIPWEKAAKSHKDRKKGR